MMTNRKGFIELAAAVVAVFLFMILTFTTVIHIKNDQLEAKDITITNMKQDAVKKSVESENKIFEVEHKTIGDAIPKKGLVHAEVNVSNGRHSITFK